jgi:hypothetical protein
MARPAINLSTRRPEYTRPVASRTSRASVSPRWSGVLKKIETRIDDLLTAFGGVAVTRKPIKAIKTKKKMDKIVLMDEDLLEGPQKVRGPKAQGYIDKLFASFD